MSVKKVKNRQKTHNWLPLADKLNIIKDVDNGMKQIDVAEKYNLSKSAVSRIIQNKENVMKTANSGEINCKKRKSMKGAHDLQLENALYTWFCQRKDTGQLVSGPMICEKALMLKKKLNKINNSDDDFKASHGWLDKFKRRHGILLYRNSLQREKLSADVEAAIKFCLDFQSLIEEEKYNENLVFNVNETGINWKSFPNKTLAPEYETDCPGRKQNKERITALFCGNATGSFRLPILVIGKPRSSRCFKHVSTLPVVYRAQKSARMDAEIFFDWYTNCFIPLVKAMQAETGQHGKVLLLLDNAKMHLSKEVLDAADENFSVHFVPLNITELIQPMGQAIIEKVKKIYRKHFLRSLLLFNDSASVDSFIKSFNLRDGCHFLASAFASLTEQNLKDGWNKLLGLSNIKSKKTSEDDSTLSLEVFSEMVNGVRGYENTTIKSTANWLAEDRYDPDWEQLTDYEIIQQATYHAEAPNIDKQNLPRDENVVSAADALVALSTFRSWCQTHQEFTKNDFNFLKNRRTLLKTILLRNRENLK